jgi:hypothetical protein
LTAAALHVVQLLQAVPQHLHQGAVVGPSWLLLLLCGLLAPAPALLVVWEVLAAGVCCPLVVIVQVWVWLPNQIRLHHQQCLPALAVTALCLLYVLPNAACGCGWALLPPSCCLMLLEC